MKTAVIAGSTGLTGSNILEQLDKSNTYTKIILLGRRPPEYNSSKASFIQTNFDDLDGIKLPHAVDEVYCCLGTTIKKAGTKEKFRQIDFDAVVELGRWTKQFETSRFIVISSLGANAKSSSFYLRTKGQMEAALKRLNLNSLIIFRPALLIGKRNEKRFTESLAQQIMPLFDKLLIGSLIHYRTVKASSLAKAMIAYAQSKFGDTYIVESGEIQKFN